MEEVVVAEVVLDSVVVEGKRHEFFSIVTADSQAVVVSLGELFIWEMEKVPVPKRPATRAHSSRLGGGVVVALSAAVCVAATAAAGWVRLVMTRRNDTVEAVCPIKAFGRL